MLSDHLSFQEETIAPRNYTRFSTKASAPSGPGPYQVIHPLTPLAELEKFFEYKAGKEGGDFALGQSARSPHVVGSACTDCRRPPFAFIDDSDGREASAGVRRGDEG